MIVFNFSTSKSIYKCYVCLGPKFRSRSFTLLSFLLLTFLPIWPYYYCMWKIGILCSTFNGIQTNKLNKTRNFILSRPSAHKSTDGFRREPSLQISIPRQEQAPEGCVQLCTTVCRKLQTMAPGHSPPFIWGPNIWTAP